ARRAALGAFRHALGLTAGLAPADRDGLQAGVAGVALAATRAAGWLSAPELAERGRAVATDAALPDGPRRCPDLLMGSAGAIIGLLALDDPRLADRAVAAGEELLERATVTGHGWSWALPGQRHPHHLCGLAHGAAGIALALLELHSATGDERF